MASPVPPASESRVWRIDFGNRKFLARKLSFAGSCLDDKVIRNRSWEGHCGVWGGSWEVFGKLLEMFLVQDLLQEEDQEEGKIFNIILICL